MDTSDRDFDFLDKFAGTETLVRPVQEEVVVDGHTHPAKEEYKAIEKSNRAIRRLEIIFTDRSRTLVSYTQLIRCIRSSGGNFLTLIFTDVVITLEGSNLASLIPLIKEEKLSAIFCFNPENDTPAPASDPFIEKITEQTVREFRGED